jgi:hypothetical protein
MVRCLSLCLTPKSTIRLKTMIFTVEEELPILEKEEERTRQRGLSWIARGEAHVSSHPPKIISLTQ